MTLDGIMSTFNSDIEFKIDEISLIGDASSKDLKSNRKSGIIIVDPGVDEFSLR